MIFYPFNSCIIHIYIQSIATITSFGLYSMVVSLSIFDSKSLIFALFWNCFQIFSKTLVHGWVTKLPISISSRSSTSVRRGSGARLGLGMRVGGNVIPVLFLDQDLYLYLDIGMGVRMDAGFVWIYFLISF